MTEARDPHSVTPEELDLPATMRGREKSKKALAPNAGKVTYMYVGYQESGEWDTFSDELEAHRYAIKGASKVRVEKRELKKRAK